jgi:hypothetical protein
MNARRAFIPVDLQMDLDLRLCYLDLQIGIRMDICARDWLASTSPRLASTSPRLASRGLIQVGVNVARSRKKKPSESVRAAGRPGPDRPADPVATTFLYTLCFDLLPRNPVSQKTIHFATQV